jgi:dihydropteroate synthase
MYSINCKGKLLRLHQPVVMGIINATPDSFYQGQLEQGIAGMVQLAGRMLQAGASILDVGGQSTRPGSQQLSPTEEAGRVIPAIAAIHQQYPNAIISADTFYSEVAAEAVAAGASMINDVSGGQMDSNMIATVATLDVPYVLMHMLGTPATMQQNPHYKNVVEEVLDYFIAKIAVCRQAGIKDIIIDPGFGFGKTIAHNFTLLQNLQLFAITACPLLAGISRKSTIYKTLGTTAAEALNGTTVLYTIALLNGAHILRVHDVKEAVEAVQLVTAMMQSK